MDTFNEQSFTFVEKMKKFADKPDPVNIFPHVTHCTLDIICGNTIIIDNGGKEVNDK